MIYLKSLTESDLPFLLEIRNDDSTRCNLENNSKFTLSLDVPKTTAAAPQQLIVPQTISESKTP